MRRILFACLLPCLLSACGGPRASMMRAVEQRDVGGSLEAYERYRSDEGADPELLGEVARLVLREEAESDSPQRRDAALHQLALAGTEGEDTLEHLADVSAHPATRAKALEVLARRGDDDARDELVRWVDHEDPVVVEAAVVALDPDEDRAALLGLLEHRAAGVRTAAARALAEAAPDADVFSALAEVARVDPAPAVRRAAVRALGAFGGLGVEVLRGRLGDPEPTVRLAAVGALVRADRERALGLLASLLEMQPTPAGIEAARVLATVEAEDEGAEPEGAVLARAYLRRALSDGDATVRAQAAVALSSLSAEAASHRAIASALEEEQEPQVRLTLARILVDDPAHREAAIEALTPLLEDGLPLPRVHAAAFLASRDIERGRSIAVLQEAMDEGEPHVRRVAARALAREAMRPDLARPALADDEPLVRIHAAGGILAALAAD